MATKSAPLPPRKSAPVSKPGSGSAARVAGAPTPLPPKKPATPAAAAPAVEPPKKKKRGGARTRSNPLDRALKFAGCALKTVGRLARLVGNWSAEATKDQSATNSEVIVALKKSQDLLERVGVDLDMLKASSFAPIEARGRAIAAPLTAGDRVTIKPKYYEPTLHGASNEWEVVIAAGNRVRIRPEGKPGTAQLVVRRCELAVLDVPADADDDSTPAPAVEPEVEETEDTENAGDEADESDEGKGELNFDRE